MSKREDERRALEELLFQMELRENLSLAVIPGLPWDWFPWPFRGLFDWMAGFDRAEDEKSAAVEKKRNAFLRSEVLRAFNEEDE